MPATAATVAVGGTSEWRDNLDEIPERRAQTKLLSITTPNKDASPFTSPEK